MAQPDGVDVKSGPRGNTRALAIEIAEGLLREGGYAAMSLDRIAQQLDIRSPSLYHHFPHGKEGLLLAVALRRQEIDGRVLSRLITKAADPVAGLRSVARYFASEAGHHPYRAIIASLHVLGPETQAAMQSGFASRVEAPLLDLVRRARAEGRFSDCDEQLVVRAFLLQMISLGEMVTSRHGRKMLPDRLVDLFIGGLLPR